MVKDEKPSKSYYYPSQTLKNWTLLPPPSQLPAITPGPVADFFAAQTAAASKAAAKKNAEKAAAARGWDPVAVCAPPPLKPGEKFPFIPLLLAKPGEFSEKARCFMCHLEEATDINYIVRALCGHVFCLRCVYKYKAALHKKRCVLCEYPYDDLVILAAKQKFPGHGDGGGGDSSADQKSAAAGGGGSQAGKSSK